MKKYFLLIFCFCSIYSNAQNLIQNPSLENLKSSVDIENVWDNQFQESINLADGGWFRAWWTPNLVNEQLSEHIDYFDHYALLDFDSINILIDENVEFFFLLEQEVNTLLPMFIGHLVIIKKKYLVTN